MDNDSKDRKMDEQLSKLEKQVHFLERIIIESNLKDMAYNFNNKREVIKVNLLAGLSRGIGFTIGTAIFLAILFSFLNKVITLPYIGEIIANLMNEVEKYRVFSK